MPRYTTDLKAIERYIQALVRELNLPVQPGPPSTFPAGGQPVIIEEPSYLGRNGVTVIWDGWSKLSGEVRGRVILEAYKRALGEEVAGKIGLAMGLTHDEYSRIQAQAG